MGFSTNPITKQKVGGGGGMREGEMSGSTARACAEWGLLEGCSLLKALARQVMRNTR